MNQITFRNVTEDARSMRIFEHPRLSLPNPIPLA
jgi:hypothetical protein